MAISKQTRDKLLVEARHRCTICSEKCFEIHHIIELAEGGADDEENLIVLCPNCHQHRYHRSGEFTRDQVRLYKAKLREANEVDRRLLLNLEEIRSQIGQASLAELTQQLHSELSEAAALVNPQRSPEVQQTIVEMAKVLASRRELPGGARKAIEIEFEIEKQKQKAQYELVEIVGVDHDAYRKSDAFPRAYVLELVLNRIPHPDWESVFDDQYRNAFYNMKRETRIVGNRIEMIIADSDNLQGHVDYAKRLVNDTNNFIHTSGFAEIDRRINAAKREALAEYDAIQSLKAKTKDLRL